MLVAVCIYNLGGHSSSRSVTSKARISASWPSRVHILGTVLPKSPCINSLMYVPASVTKSSLKCLSSIYYNTLIL